MREVKSTVKYMTEEALSEIVRRSDRIIVRRSRRACRLLSGTAGGLFALLVLLIAALPGGPAAASAGTVYGSFLLSAEAGGYVLTAVIAFVLGIAVTLLCRRRKTQAKQPDEEDVP